MTGRAALLECRLMEMLFTAQPRFIGMAAQADIHRVWFWQPGGPGSMRIVTIRAIAQRSGMLHLCLFDLFRFLGVACNAELLWTGCRQGDLAVFCRLMACAAGAGAAIKGRMHYGLHQLGPVRLMRVVALETVGLHKRLVVVNLLQPGIVSVMPLK